MFVLTSSCCLFCYLALLKISLDESIQEQTALASHIMRSIEFFQRHYHKTQISCSYHFMCNSLITLQLYGFRFCYRRSGRKTDRNNVKSLGKSSSSFKAQAEPMLNQKKIPKRLSPPIRYLVLHAVLPCHIYIVCSCCFRLLLY